MRSPWCDVAEDLLGALSRVPPTRDTGDRRRWETADGRFIEAHRYPPWCLVAEGGGWVGYGGSCMRRGHAERTIRALLEEHAQRQQGDLFGG